MAKAAFAGRVIVDGEARGRLVCVRRPVSFLGMFVPEEGVLRVDGASISVAGSVLAVPGTVGSTVAPYVIYRSAKLGKAPAAIVSLSVDAYLASGCAISKIPLVELKEGFEELCGLSGSTAVLRRGGTIEVE